MCNLLKVSRSGYYRFRANPESARERRTEELREEIKKVYFEQESLYGSPRIAAELVSKGISISTTTVAKHLHAMNLITGFIYLTVIIDLFDRKVIGWSISDGMSAKGDRCESLTHGHKK